MSQQIQITGGAKVRNLEGVLTGTAGVVNSLGINVPDGIPQLDGSGKILVSQLPNSVMEYKGTWNAATNTPTLANGTGNAGDVYLCNVAGTTNFGAGPITFAVGDQVLYSGTTWEKASGATGTVTSVAVTESGDALTITGSPITTSGTINIGFAGTGSQYIKGDGTLATFPTTIDQAKRLITEVYNSTGATLTKGTVVYINGGHGNLPTITKAQANADNTSAQTYGVVQSDITNMNNGFVVVFGSLTDLDTQAYSVGTQLYLSGTTAGAWTSTKPSAPIHLVYVGIVVRSHPTQGVVEIRIQNGYELEELHDVAISSVANNDGIFYNSSTDLWENKTIGEVLGYTPANASLVVPYTGATANVVLDDYTLSGKSISYTGTAGSGFFKLNQQGQAAIPENGTVKLSIGTTSNLVISSNSYNSILATSANTADRTYTFPDASGTLALTSNLSSYVPYTGATTFVNLGTQLFYSGGVEVANGGNGSIITDGYLRAGKGIFLTDTVSGGQWSSGTTNLVARSSGFLITRNSGGGVLIFDPSVTYNYTFPAVSGTIALTSNLSSYLPLSGGTLTGNLTLSSASTPLLQIVDTTNSKSLLFGADDNNTFIRSSSSTPILFQVNGGDTALTLASNQTATFSNNIMIGAGKYLGYSASAYITPEDNIQGARVKTSGGFVVESAGATFSGNYGTSAGVYLSGTTYGTFGANRGASSASAGMNYYSVGTQKWFTGIYENSDNFGFYSVAAGGFPLVLTTSGNVGIGTSSPDSYPYGGKLNVNGSISLNSGKIGWGVTDAFTAYGSSTAHYGITYNASSNPIAISGYFGIGFFSDGTERMRITSVGAVGINTSSPSSTSVLTLQESSALSGALSMLNRNGNQRWLLAVDAVSVDDKYFAIIDASNNAVRMSISNTGAIKVHDGTLTGGGGFEFTSEAFFGARFQSNAYKFMAGNNSSEYMRITSSGNVGIGTSSPSGKLHVYNASGPSLIYNQNYNGVNSIWNASDGGLTFFGNISSHPLAFITNDTERMRITSGGAVCIGGTSYGGIGISFNQSVGQIFNYSGTGVNTNIEFKNSNGTVGYIQSNGSSTSYITSSDYRLKEDLKEINGLEKVSAIKVYDFKWKASNERTDGVLAHELAEILPYAVSGEKDGENMQGVDYSKIVPILVKAIQELNEKIKQLENK